MNHLLWLLKWLFKAAIFFTLFAFALNNQQDTTVHFFFGNAWRAPQVLVVLGAFTAGVVVGVLGMLPRLIDKQMQKSAALSEVIPSTSRAPVVAPSYADGI